MSRAVTGATGRMDSLQNLDIGTEGSGNHGEVGGGLLGGWLNDEEP